jgi:long-chain acyl-CoA synthetase
MVNLAERVWAQADKDPAKTALTSPRGSMSYGELKQRSGRVARAVREAGLAPLDRVILIAPSVIEFPVVYFGLHAAGATIITMNVMATHPEIAYVIEDADASLVIAWHENGASAESAARAAGIPFWRVEDGAAFDEEPDNVVHSHDEADTSVVLYTSGTTGKPKGAELTAGNLDAVSTILIDCIEFSSDDVVATALPLFHAYGQASIMNLALVSGATFSVLSPFEPTQMLDLIARDRVTLVAGVPTMWNAMLQVAREGVPLDFRSLRYASSGGAALPIDVLKEFQERFGADLLEGYGLTETTAVATTHSADIEKRPGTVGVAAPGMSIEIRDELGNSVAAGVVGEIFVKGPSVMKGYWNRPEATSEVLEDGWLRTGDLGHLDADGYLTIVDRVKDMIIRGGYNVYPREVEEVLYEHPDIIEVAVVGVPDTHFGEEVGAVVVTRGDSTLGGPELRRWAKERLSAYKVPRLIQFVDTLPKGPTGKIMKRSVSKDGLLASRVRP